MAGIFSSGYGDSFGLQASDLRGQNQVLTQWSGQVLRLGMDMLVFPRFLAQAPPGIAMGLQKGDTFRIPIFNWITSTSGTTPLSSGTTIGLLSQGTLNVYGTLDEYGQGIGMENVIDYYTKLNNAAELLETLANNRARVLNELCRAVIDNTPHIAVCGVTGTTGTTRFNLSSTSGIATTAISTLSSGVIKSVSDFFKGQRVPTFGNGLYVYVGNAAHLRGLKNEGVFENYNYYNNPGFNNGIVYQVLGNWEGFTFVQTEEGMAGTYGYALAPEIGAVAYAKPISLHYYPDINSDANRLNVIKWHMIAGFAKTLRDYGTRAIKVYTA
jgi:hypothetical protein